MTNFPALAIRLCVNSTWGTCQALLALLIVIASAEVYAVEIKGKVAAVQSELVTLTLDGELAPSVGDSVEIYVEIPGLDDGALVATGKVAEVQDGTVTVKIIEAPGSPEKNQLARISSPKPTKRMAGSNPSPTTRNTPAPRSGASTPPDDSFVAPAGRTGEIASFPGHDEAVHTVALLSDGRRAVSVSYDRNLRVLDLTSGQILRRTYLGENPVLCFAVAPNGRRGVAGCENGTVQLWDLEEGRVIRTFQGHTTPVDSVALSPDGQRILSGSGVVDLRPVAGTDPNNQEFQLVRDDCTVRLWDVPTGRQVFRFTGHQGTVKSVAFSPDGRYALSASTDRTIRLLDLSSGRQVRQFMEPRPIGVLKVAFSPDGQRFLTASGGFPALEDDPTAAIERPVVPPGLSLPDSPPPLAPDVPPVSPVTPGADFTDGAESDAYALRLWDLRTGRVVHSLVGHTSEIQSTAFSPDGRRAISGSYDQTMRLWDLEAGQQIFVAKGHEATVYCVAFSPDGQRAISGSGDNTVRLWALPK